MDKGVLRAFMAVAAMLVAMFFVGCDVKMTSDEILEKQGSGVVMVVNQYYYKITLPTGKEWYFTGFDDDGEMENLTLDLKEALDNRAVLTGTGFFVSKTGQILTNRHVAMPSVSLSDTKKSVRSVIEGLKQLVQQEMQQLSDRYDELEAEKENCYTTDYFGNSYVDSERMEQINSQQEELQTTFNNDMDTYNQLDDFDPSEIKVEPVCELGCAYNNTFVTKVSDLKPCVATAVSDNQDIDLALLQLKDKKTPEGRYVFDVDKKESKFDITALFSPKKDDMLSTGQVLYMVGFNAGFTVSNTSQGIKAQITRGEISQVTDANKIMYTIPSLPGSSGSPVINDHGQLVAVNFAGFQNTQSFNYGIPFKKVKQFLDNNM